MTSWTSSTWTTMSSSESIFALALNSCQWTCSSFWKLTTSTDLIITWSADSLSNSCMLSSISRCSKLFTVISNQKTSYWRSPTRAVSKLSISALPLSWANESTLTSSHAFTVRLRSCSASHTTVQSTCGHLAALWRNSTSDIPFSQVTARMTKCRGWSRCSACQTKT